jgi:hypothetical protein
VARKYPILMNPKTKAQDLKKVKAVTQISLVLEEALMLPQMRAQTMMERVMKTLNPVSGTSTA